jgi:hypothetical protein
MFSERRTVSRKTPGDGKLEITKQAAQTLETLGPEFTIELDGNSGTATLSAMECTCRNADTPHVHYFLESEHFKALEPGSTVEIGLEGGTSRLTVTPNVVG